MKVPNRIYVQSTNESGEDLLAWRKLTATDDGKVYVYELIETIDKRTVSEVKREGTKTWFKGLRLGHQSRSEGVHGDR